MAHIAAFIGMLISVRGLTTGVLVAVFLFTEWYFRNDNSARIRYPLIIVLTMGYFGGFVRDAFQANAVLFQLVFGLFASIFLVTIIFAAIPALERIKKAVSGTSNKSASHQSNAALK